MPLVTLTVRKALPADQRRLLLDAVHDALVSVGVPADDRFQRVIALDDEDLVVDPSYPDAARPRDRRFVIVEILWSAGRSVKVKRQLLARLVSTLSEAGADPEQVFVVFKETTWENWSFAGGRLLHA
jgi:phenylpyruvate tautomerase PptA (4-oxalocrotonate tautomerase family)